MGDLTWLSAMADTALERTSGGAGILTCSIRVPAEDSWPGRLRWAMSNGAAYLSPRSADRRV